MDFHLSLKANRSHIRNLPSTTIMANDLGSLSKLAPELRIQVYRHVASQSSLRLRASGDREEPSKVPGLMLASRRINQEYRPILLSETRLERTLDNFDCSKTKTTASFSLEDMRALGKNRKLVVRLTNSSDDSCDFARLHTPLKVWLFEDQDTVGEVVREYTKSLFLTTMHLDGSAPSKSIPSVFAMFWLSGFYVAHFEGETRDRLAQRLFQARERTQYSKMKSFFEDGRVIPLGIASQPAGQDHRE